ncbi:hypothetical protein MTO96_001600 [Rhipicephalus appendiculatus]
MKTTASAYSWAARMRWMARLTCSREHLRSSFRMSPYRVSPTEVGPPADPAWWTNRFVITYIAQGPGAGYVIEVRALANRIDWARRVPRLF